MDRENAPGSLEDMNLDDLDELSFGDEEDDPLMGAIGKGDVAGVRRLIENGVDVAVSRGFMAQTPLHAAAVDGDGEIIRMLLEAGSDLSAREFLQETPLCIAARWQHVQVVKMMLDAGADATARNMHQDTVLRVATHAAAPVDKRVLMLLIKAGADILECDPHGNTLLHGARKRGLEEVVQILLDLGVDETARNRDGKTAKCLGSLTAAAGRIARSMEDMP